MVRKGREINGDEGGKQILRVKVLRKNGAERRKGGEEGREVGREVGRLMEMKEGGKLKSEEIGGRE